MKTNIEFLNDSFCTAVGIAYFCAGRDLDNDPIVEVCEVYKAVDGEIFAYCSVLKEVVQEYGDVIFYDSPYFHNCGRKRGRHSNSHNKKTVRHAQIIKSFETLNDLPF